MSQHGYEYSIGVMYWRGENFNSREEARDTFISVRDNWINDALPAPKKWWQFWRPEVEMPDPEKHSW